MPKQSHPAHRARVSAGLAGATGFVVMVGTVAEGSKQVTTVDTAAAISSARLAALEPTDLQGSALAGAAASTSGAIAQPGEVPSATTAPTAAPAAQPDTQATAPVDGPSATTAVPSTAVSATALPATALPSTALPTTAAPTTSPPTTSAPTTDTTSSAS
ncbi:MAG: hypothetical protein ACRBK7_33130 [Acidimicrobiales bacterium]